MWFCSEKRQPAVMSEIESPCVRNCCLDDKDVCLGCFRTLGEILAWGEASDDRKREILVQAAKRREQRQQSSWGASD